jgi:hypothetical protein
MDIGSLDPPNAASLFDTSVVASNNAHVVILMIFLFSCDF